MKFQQPPEGVQQAIRAVFRGQGSPQQQRAVMGYILNACGVLRPSYGETERASAYLEGRRSVGLHIAEVSALKILLEGEEIET